MGFEGRRYVSAGSLDGSQSASRSIERQTRPNYGCLSAAPLTIASVCRFNQPRISAQRRLCLPPAQIAQRWPTALTTPEPEQLETVFSSPPAGGSKMYAFPRDGLLDWVLSNRPALSAHLAAAAAQQRASNTNISLYFFHYV